MFFMFTIFMCLSAKVAAEKTPPKTQDDIDISRVDNLLCEQTYLGLILGTPNKNISKREMKQFHNKVDKFNYERIRAIFTIKPVMIKEKSSRKEYFRLPRYACSVLLYSYYVIKDTEDFYFSEAVVIFYQEESPILHGVDINKIIEGLVWKNIAQNGTF